MKTKLISQWTKENKPIGEHFGYPDCCINEFCGQPPQLMRGKQPTRSDRARLKASYIGGVYSGFIPCKKHARLVNEGKLKLEDLIKNRKEKIPFPNS